MKSYAETSQLREKLRKKLNYAEHNGIWQKLWFRSLHPQQLNVAYDVEGYVIRFWYKNCNDQNVNEQWLTKHMKDESLEYTLDWV